MVVFDAAADACPCCGGTLHSIGESVSEMLDRVPAQLRVIRIRRPKNGFTRHGIEIDRSTLAGWVGGACWWLDALYEKLCANVFASDHLFADDTPIPVLDPGRGRTKTGRLWVYARDQRPWDGSAPPAAIFVFAPDRKGERPASHLENFSGVLHVDGYAGFERLAGRGNVILAACWSHTRRNFYEFFEANGSPVAAEALRRIGELYAIEERIRGQSPALRLAERRTFSKPLVEKLRVWFEKQLSRGPRRGKLADAIRYALVRWDGLTRFLHDGRVELDTNPVERAIRPVALGRKNHSFAGSDERVLLPIRLSPYKSSIGWCEA
jgi:transposase